MAQLQPPAQSQFQGQGVYYIKQLEDIFLPPQPFTDYGFARRGLELKPQSEIRQWGGAGRPMVQMPIHRDFLPIKSNYGSYLYNMENGYVERDKVYTKYTTGFVNRAL